MHGIVGSECGALQRVRRRRVDGSRFTAQLVGTFAEERRVRSGDPRAVGLRCRRTPLQFGHEFAQALLHPRLGAIRKGASFAFEDGALVCQRTALAFGGKPLGPQAVAFGLQLDGAQGEFGQGRLVVTLSSQAAPARARAHLR